MIDYTFREEFCIEDQSESCGLIIFGASGDLTRRKLIPALFNLFQRDLTPKDFFVCGVARTPMTDDQFRDLARNAITPHNDSIEIENDFVRRFFYLSGNYDTPKTYTDLRDRLDLATTANHIFYLSTPPQLYATIAEHLSRAGLVKIADKTWKRVIVEKPFGRDLETALKLDRALNAILTEDQIYRIDHYLGKETVQNIMIFRFANAIFEPIWNHQHVDHVEITVAESIGVEHRAGYYDRSGALRDMFQNHMFQMLSIVAMEPPTAFDAKCVHDEKVKVLNAIRPFSMSSIVRGQYSENGDLIGYRDENGVAENSQTETYVAMKLMIDNWRWRGVPFYLRSGKRLKRRVSEIAVYFKNVPHSIFAPITPDQLSQNVLVFNVQPEEGISLTIEAKQPGPRLCMGALTLQFDYRKIFNGKPPDAYERLLHDCMLGDQTLFVRSDGVETAWKLLDPILEDWSDQPQINPLQTYSAGSWGPISADQLLNRNDHFWRKP